MAWSTGALVANLRDRDKWARIADWLAILVAVELPWSTTYAALFLALWALATLAAREFKDQAPTPAATLPVALWMLAVIGMLWADAPPAERFNGLSSLFKLLAIPALFAQFRRSERGPWVLIAFVASSAILLAVSWGLALLPGLPWRGRDLWVPGVPVKDYIAQAQTFTLCAFGLCEGTVLAWRWGRRRLAVGLLLLAFAFLANVLYVAPSRTALVTIPFLLLLFAVLRFGWKGACGLLILTAALSAVAWQTSPWFHHRLVTLPEEVRNFDPRGASTSAGQRLEYWRKSIIFIADAPVFGHGTGSIREQFRRAAVDQTGVAAEVSANPHNQILAVAIQLGVVGAALLLAMWIAHLLLFWGSGPWALLGLILVVQNIVGSLSIRTCSTSRKAGSMLGASACSAAWCCAPVRSPRPTASTPPPVRWAAPADRCKRRAANGTPRGCNLHFQTKNPHGVPAGAVTLIAFRQVGDARIAVNLKNLGSGLRRSSRKPLSHHLAANAFSPSCPRGKRTCAAATPNVGGACVAFT
jgi:O-antigen ligase